ncbi:hypothetical protein CXB51_019891 [Gossypium anomalum]|uniref:Uncharacterized protein n=1 Tax=Gossypium anomalum TaxID=47600 RepID=A0A8J5YPF3_9ROSI|nr:hypothetical protein CXB51_019891 [Gossypium anomalum]
MRCFIAPFCSIQMYGCADVKLQTSGFYRYREHVVWGDKDLRLKLLRKGILTRKYIPMKNYDHLLKETHFGLYREATRGNPNYFLTYGNEKEAARVQDELRPNGAH